MSWSMRCKSSSDSVRNSSIRTGSCAISLITSSPDSIGYRASARCEPLWLREFHARFFFGFAHEPVNIQQNEEPVLQLAHSPHVFPLYSPDPWRWFHRARGKTQHLRHGVDHET